ncbi:hypothetical protein BT96DRAFT_1004679 [Gymnopus androsaceus JB14]|uniref:Uncharacterized protein n=1 Tax=Gymnopus androsaceus JB14 TaxID=1447944 RepID=A0A6A4GQJ2_9AGAR|nr:hypothetical protein BT96DRAFT_1004679 [Gymnopus androsaceus JB14]
MYTGQVHPRINSGGKTHQGDDPRGNIRDTDGDQWADLDQKGLRPSCHPRTSEGEISLPDESLTPPMSSPPPPDPLPAPAPPPCINPHTLDQFKSTTVNSHFGTSRPLKRDWMDQVAIQQLHEQDLQEIGDLQFPDQGIDFNINGYPTKCQHNPIY